MTIRALALAAVATFAVAGSASAFSINDENLQRQLTQPSFAPVAGSFVFEGRASQEPVGFSINDENLQRAHSSTDAVTGVSGVVIEGRSSASVASTFINDENRDRFQTFGR
ncbi:MAG: hypothetical protein AAF321_09570 [Pseudomonadota bacterium]